MSWLPPTPSKNQCIRCFFTVFYSRQQAQKAIWRISWCCVSESLKLHLIPTQIIISWRKPRFQVDMSVVCFTSHAICCQIWIWVNTAKIFFIYIPQIALWIYLTSQHHIWCHWRLCCCSSFESAWVFYLCMWKSMGLRCALQGFCWGGLRAEPSSQV